MDDTNNYEVVRFYQDGRKPRVQKRNVTRVQAEAWCDDPETSSKTASKYASMTKRSNLDKKQAHWFDGFREQK